MRPTQNGRVFFTYAALFYRTNFLLPFVKSNHLAFSSANLRCILDFILTQLFDCIRAHISICCKFDITIFINIMSIFMVLVMYTNLP